MNSRVAEDTVFSVAEDTVFNTLQNWGICLARPLNHCIYLTVCDFEPPSGFVVYSVAFPAV